jgi:hypothetical protein
MKVNVTAPGSQPTDSPKPFITPGNAIAEITMPLKIDWVGKWIFQVIATSTKKPDQSLPDVAKVYRLCENSAWWIPLRGQPG